MARGLGNGSCKPLLQPGQGAELAQLRLLTAIQPQKQGAGHPVLGLGLLAITKVLWALNCWPLCGHILLLFWLGSGYQIPFGGGSHGPDAGDAWVTAAS